MMAPPSQICSEILKVWLIHYGPTVAGCVANTIKLLRWELQIGQTRGIGLRLAALHINVDPIAKKRAAIRRPQGDECTAGDDGAVVAKAHKA